MFVCLIYFSPLFIALYSLYSSSIPKKKIRKKKILVVGGSSGLGYAFVKILATQENSVIGTSRDIEYVRLRNEEEIYRFMVLDVCNESTFEKEETKYDYIFYCTGLSIPGRNENRTTCDFLLSSNTNYMGMIKVLKHYSEINKKPFDFVMVGSTLALFPVPGYSTYSPTKSAVLSFFTSTYEEFKDNNITLHLFNPSSMETRGFRRENLIKDTYNIQLESIFNINTPEECAEHFLKEMWYRKVIVMDFFTYLCQVKYECEKPIDYLMFPLAVVVVFIAKVITKVFYKVYYRNGRR